MQRRRRPLSPEAHHSEPQLHDDNDGGGAQADREPLAHPPRARGELPVRLRGRSTSHGGTRGAVPRHRGGQRSESEQVPVSARLQPHPADRCVPRQRLHQRGDEDVQRDAQDPPLRHQVLGHLREGAVAPVTLGSGMDRDRETTGSQAGAGRPRGRSRHHPLR